MKRDGYPDQDLIRGDGSMFTCVWKAEMELSRAASKNIEDLDKAKMGLCKPFKTLLENCSIPISGCIEDIGIKEIVMAEFLREILAKTRNAMEIVEKYKKPNFFGDFTYEDCVIFGGHVAGATFGSPGWVQIILPSLATYLLLK